MPQAGDTIVLATVPGANVATTEQTSDSTTFTTTETVIMTISVPLVIGRRYRIHHTSIIASNAAGATDVMVRLREDSVIGTILTQEVVTVGGSAFGWGPRLFREFTAVATANKTFVVTGERIGGVANTMRLEADATRPAYLYVDYTRDG